MEILQRWLYDESRDKLHEELQESYTPIVSKITPQQPNGADCGVFVLMFVDFMCDDLNVSRFT
jgi:Ulp1 family protease